jgi:ABC-type multidrug transport system ATPase subunit
MKERPNSTPEEESKGGLPDDQATTDGSDLSFVPGQKIAGRYRIEELLGRGAFGEVYRAYDELLGRIIALKTVALERAGGKDDGGLDAVLEEARTVAKLDHQSIVPVYDVGTEGKKVWMAMKLVEGKGLAAILQDEGKMNAKRAVQLLCQAARALDHAHRKGIIHRDVKPSNILVERQADGTEHVWLADFGIAKIITGKTTRRDQSLIGTPGYMAPEQITGKRVDARADIFALGCVAYELIIGAHAFDGSTYEVLYSVVHEQPKGLSELGALAGKGFEKLVRKALSKSPEDRYQTAEEMARELDGLAKEGGAQNGRNLRSRLLKLLQRPEAAHWDGRDALVVRELYKGYKFRQRVLNGITLNVPTGSIYGLLGRNGSGKTTLIRTVLGIYQHDSGSISIFGRDPHREGPAALSRIGYVPETLAAYDSMTVSQLLTFLRPFYPKWDNGYCYHLMGRYELPLEVKIRDLSKGMKTKVSLICALSHRPEFLVLDDPTVGLDAVTLGEVFETLHEISEREAATVFISSHNIDEVEKIATHIGFIKEGRLLLADTLEGLRMRTREVKLTFRDEVPDLRGIRHFKALRTSGRRVTGVVLDTSSDAMEKLKALGAEQIEVRELNLKEIFVNFLR